MSKTILKAKDVYEALTERKNETGVIWRTIAEKAGLGLNTINKCGRAWACGWTRCWRSWT